MKKAEAIEELEELSRDIDAIEKRLEIILSRIKKIKSGLWRNTKKKERKAP